MGKIGDRWLILFSVNTAVFTVISGFLAGIDYATDKLGSRNFGIAMLLTSIFASVVFTLKIVSELLRRNKSLKEMMEKLTQNKSV